MELSQIFALVVMFLIIVTIGATLGWYEGEYFKDAFILTAVSILGFAALVLILSFTLDVLLHGHITII